MIKNICEFSLGNVRYDQNSLIHNKNSYSSFLIFHVFPYMKVKVKLLSRVRLFVTPWTVAHQAPLSMGLSRHEYLSGLPCPPPGDLRNPGIKPVSLKSPALACGFFATWEAPYS